MDPIQKCSFLKIHPLIFHANPSCGLIVWMVCFLGSPRHTSKPKVFFRKPSWVVATQIFLYSHPESWGDDPI